MFKLFNIFVEFIRSVLFGKRLAVPDDVSPLELSDAIPEEIFSAEESPVRRVVRQTPPPIPAVRHPDEIVLDNKMHTAPLFMDLYQGDYPNPDLKKVASDTRYCGVILKATEGDYYNPSWFVRYWGEAKNASQARYGLSWFRGAYHYLKFNISGAKQADFYLSHLEKAGGWDLGDIWPIVDIERGHTGGVNWLAKRQQIEDITSAWAERVQSVTGRPVMLYGNGIMRDREIKSRMGCDWLWVPRYTEELPPIIWERAGWTRDRLWGWQYCGDGVAKLPSYPSETPLGKKGDISVLVMDGGLERMRIELK